MSLIAALGRISQRDDVAFLDATNKAARQFDEAEGTDPGETLVPEAGRSLPPVAEHEVGGFLPPAIVEPPTLVASTQEKAPVIADNPSDVAPLNASENPVSRATALTLGDLEAAYVADTGGKAVRPDWIPASSGAIALTPEEREVAFASAPVIGSIVDGGSAQDMLDGKHPRPSVASQREIDQFNRIRMAGLELNRPKNWPDFMTFPTESELRFLTQEGVTPEMIKGFEASKQQQADEMETRAREINDWIFSWGDMRLNEGAQMQRSRNRQLAARRRATGPDGRVDKDQEGDFDPAGLTDEELYADRHYGIRFALLLSPDPDAVNRLRSAPVAAWGHDQLRTMDGGRLQIKGDEIIVRTSSMDAAKLLVLEAQARGWETIRVSGHNEFCAAVKRAAKEAGMGATISRRGPLGLGPFGRPEVVMPAIPRVQPLNRKDPNEPEREKRSSAAPEADRTAADGLLDPPPRSARRPLRVRDPLVGPARNDPWQGSEQSAPEPS